MPEKKKSNKNSRSSKDKNEKKPDRKTFNVKPEVWNEFLKAVIDRKGGTYGEPLTEAIEEALKLYTSLYNLYQESFKLYRVFSYRRSEEEKFDIQNLYEESILNSTELKFIGNSMRDFILPEGKYRYIIDKVIRSESASKIRMILLHPCGPATLLRAKIEEPKKIEQDNFIDTQLFKDKKKILHSLNNDPILKNKIDVVFSTMQLQSYIILTTNLCFFEPYHAGRIKGIDKKKYGIFVQEEEFVECLGGYVPYFVFEKGSVFYELHNSHFENLWKHFKEKGLDLKEATKALNDYEQGKIK